MPQVQYIFCYSLFFSFFFFFLIAFGGDNKYVVQINKSCSLNCNSTAGEIGALYSIKRQVEVIGLHSFNGDEFWKLSMKFENA